MTSASLSIKPVWISDPHLDHLNKKDPEALMRLRSVLQRERITHILLGGDIADSRNFEQKMRRFADICGRPIYFVLGNHDYYFGSVEGVRRTVFSLDIPGVQWLPEEGIVDLGGGTALIGQGGWGDACRGDTEDFVILTDYAAISDLALTIDREDFWVNGFKKRDRLVSKLQQLGQEAAKALSSALSEAAEYFSRVLILTHVTPLRQTCTYRDRPGNDKGFPGFLWGAMESVLIDFAAVHPDISFLVFSGHTHQESRAAPAQNLNAWSFYAEYGELYYRIVRPEKGWEPGPPVRV